MNPGDKLLAIHGPHGTAHLWVPGTAEIHHPPGSQIEVLYQIPDGPHPGTLTCTRNRFLRGLQDLRAYADDLGISPLNALHRVLEYELKDARILNLPDLVDAMNMAANGEDPG